MIPTSSDPAALTAAIRQAEAALAQATADRDALLIECIIQDEWTHDVAAHVFGMSRQRVSQLVKRYRAAHQPRAFTAAERLHHAREAYRNAQHAQALRCEAETGGARREMRAFYGAQDESPADVVEAPVRWAGFYESEAAAKLRYEEAS